MKVSRKNTVKLERGERRIGNFFIKKESGHIKIQDLNSVYSFRISKRMPAGVWLDNMLDRGAGAEESLHVYFGALWSFISVAPDQKYIEDAIALATAALDRHPDWYGYNKTDDGKENDEALREVKEMTEFEDEVRNLKDDD